MRDAGEMRMRVLLIGNSAREHIIAERIVESRHRPMLFAFMAARNPGIDSLAESVAIGKLDDVGSIVDFARNCGVDIAFVSPELPLAAGVVDALEAEGVRCFGPCRALAELESSKSFVLGLMDEFGIAGAPRHKAFDSIDGVYEFLVELDSSGAGFVVKPDGLTGGKGVKVSGEHLDSPDDAVAYCRDILSSHGRVVIEEKLTGEEFSLMSFVDGRTVVDMPPVQDHKRAFDGDAGSNTGGMGSYSCPLNLPFLSDKDIEDAHAITVAVNDAMFSKYGIRYKGVMYGGFMATADGVKLIEYNARFGDPEAMNVLSLLETDFLDVCLAVTEGRLDPTDVAFRNMATVCKYLVPADYPGGKGGGEVDVSGVGPETKLYFASVDSVGGRLVLGTSRAVAVVGVADTLSSAEQIAEDACRRVSGAVRHRTDIGTDALVTKRTEHMRLLRERMEKK